MTQRSCKFDRKIIHFLPEIGRGKTKVKQFSIVFKMIRQSINNSNLCLHYIIL